MDSKYTKIWGQKKVLQQVTTVYTTPYAKNFSGGRGLNRIITVPISNSSTICIVKTRFNNEENGNIHRIDAIFIKLRQFTQKITNLISSTLANSPRCIRPTPL